MSESNTLKSDHVSVQLLAPQEAGRAADTFAIQFKLEPGWHIYWRNPGDSGSAPKFQFNTADAVVGEILWPVPKRLPLGSLTNLGYDQEVAFPFLVTPKPEASRLKLEAKLEWLVCQEECVPGFGTLSIDRPISQTAKWNEADQNSVQAFASQAPATGASAYKVREAKLDKEIYRVSLEGPKRDSAPDLYPFDGEFLSAKAPEVKPTDRGYDYAFQTIAGKPAPEATTLLLTESKTSWELSTAQVSSTPLDALALTIILLSSLLGGLLLNLMPCVLPVLSIKFMSLTRAGEGARVRDSLLYTAGVVVTFGALGAVFLILRSFGAAIGWGFQLQSPVIVLALAALFWMMAMNFLGVFELGTSVMNAAGRAPARNSFATGVLSVFVAAPCTGPFMGSALGAASVVPAWQAMGIFLSMGLGLSLPFLAFAASPALAKKMPKPGAWMDRLKQFFAFPLFATVLWLLWVLGSQIGTDGWVIGASLMLALSFALWIGRSPRAAVRSVAWILAAASLVVAANSVRAPALVVKEASEMWQPYTKEKLKEARASKRAVFVDFTAAWCISCQVNKKTVLSTKATEELFASKNVVLLEGDWTNQDPLITEALAELGRNSVPVYVFYPADGSEPKVLPQILTAGILEDLFK